MIAMSTVLEKSNPFKTIFGYASMLAEDGRPMHKSWGNSIEFNEGADKIGVDVMRWMYATTDPEQNLLFGYKRADETRRRFHLMLWNIYNFFVTYANIDDWEPNIANFSQHTSENVLDKWIVSRLHKTIQTVTENLDKKDPQGASLPIEKFVDDLSLWYIRRSRERVGPTAEDAKDKKVFYETTYAVLLTLCKLLAPFVPFISDEIYTNLINEESVHLAHWPTAVTALIDIKLEKEMTAGRELVSEILMKRKTVSVKVRIPLKKVSYTGPEQLTEAVRKVVSDEVNVQELAFAGKSSEYVVTTTDEELTDVSNQDVLFGEAREIVRRIQEERKKMETKLDERVTVALETWPKQYEAYIMKNALIQELQKGPFQVKKLSA